VITKSWSGPGLFTSPFEHHEEKGISKSARLSELKPQETSLKLTGEHAGGTGL